MKPIPIATFRVHPEKKSLFFKVIVWRTIKDLRDSNPRNSHTLALCRCHERMRVYRRGDYRKDRLIPELGEVHFCRRHLKVGIIAHEFTHAAIGWAARKRVKVRIAPNKIGEFSLLNRNHPEERFCHALGWMVSQCVIQLYRRKILK